MTRRADRLFQIVQILRGRRLTTAALLAERLGVSRQAVSKWESGTSDPSTSNLLALAKLFGIDAKELLDETKNAE